MERRGTRGDGYTHGPWSSSTQLDLSRLRSNTETAVQHRTTAHRQGTRKGAGANKRQVSKRV